jgi:hypothetical protein
MLRYITILFFLNYLCGSVLAQNRNNNLSDSSYIYRKIEDFCDKRKCTKLLYRLVFRPVNPTPVKSSRPSSSPVDLNKPFSYVSFEGKVIRDIVIVTYDPFGYNPKDTSIHPEGFLPKAGNSLHVKTLPVKIKNIMLIKKFDTFDSLRVKESERLIREQGFTREVYLTPYLSAGDSVDIFVRVYDAWSILLTGGFNSSTYFGDGKDKNFMGTGHQFQGSYKQNYIKGKNTYTFGYTIPNIYNTYINSSLRYYKDENDNFYQGIAFNRSFYSVLTSWAGGASFQRNSTHEILYGFDSTGFYQHYLNHIQDYWVGRSWQLSRGKSEQRRATSFIVSCRYMSNYHLERAPELFDSLHIHANEDLYLAGVGISRRLYKQDNYIFRYGYIEDVPTGRAYSLISGYQIRDGIKRLYGGGRIYMANYHDWGYFNVYFEYGTFIRKGNTEEGCFSTGINYFSNIIRIGRWKFRQFIKPQYVVGFDRKVYDKLTLDNDNGIRGFNSSGLSGTERLTFTFQLQSYAPWNILGFRFGPYAVCSFGMLGTEKSGFSHSAVYSSYGIGLLIKNDYLVMNNFQVSLVYYPMIPGVNENVIKINPVKTSDFGFRGFDISQPATVVY